MFWLVGLLAILSLSEVIIGFAWSTLFSRTAGITNLFVALGLMDEAGSLSPSFGAVLTGMVYQAFPYTVLVLYPSVARLDPSLVEAARTLGASPIRAFFNLVVPVLRNALLATLIMVFVFALGSYLLPQLLGRPQHWTLSVLITDQAIYQSNMPFAAAMAVFLVLVSLALVGLSLIIGRRGARRMMPRRALAALRSSSRSSSRRRSSIVAGVSVNAAEDAAISANGLFARLVRSDRHRSRLAERAAHLRRHRAPRGGARRADRLPARLVAVAAAALPGRASSRCWG